MPQCIENTPSFLASETDNKNCVQEQERWMNFVQLVGTLSDLTTHLGATNLRGVFWQILREIGQFADAEWCCAIIMSRKSDKADTRIEWSRSSEAVNGPLGKNGFSIPLEYNGRRIGGLSIESLAQNTWWLQYEGIVVETISRMLANCLGRAYTEDDLPLKIAVWEAIPDTLIQTNRQGVVVDFKPSPGYPLKLSSKALCRHITSILPKSSTSKAIYAITNTLETGEVQTFEYALPKDEGMMYFEARVAKNGDDDVLMIIRDISEKRQSQDCEILLLDLVTMVQAERSLEEIMAMACTRIMAIFHVLLLWVDSKEVNNAVRLFTAVKDSGQTCRGESFAGNELTGTAIRTGKFQLMSIDDPRMLPWRDQLKEYSVTTGAAFPLVAGGVVLGSLTVFTGEIDFWTGRLIVRLTNLVDQLALALQATVNRQKLRLLTTGLEAAANAIVITSRNGDIQWINPAFQRLNGYSAEEAINSNVAILQSNQHSKGFFRAMWKHLAAGRIWSGELVNRRKDGSTYFAETTITPVRNEAGGITNYISIIQDISQRKQAELEMMEAREVRVRSERLSALGIMTAGIAHEINQPLNSLKIMADGMLYWYRQGKIPEIGKAMATIHDISQEANRIDAIIKHMRTFVHNSDAPQLVACDINQVVEQALSLIGTQIRDHGIEIKKKLSETAPAVAVNATQMEQILINLLINAMHSLDTSDVSLKQITIATGCKKGRVYLAVTDNGAGIRREIRNKIFDPFFTTKSVGKGMGLGLSVVHTIVTSYGGCILVKDNKPAGGVTLWLEFPVKADSKKGEGS